MFRPQRTFFVGWLVGGALLAACAAPSQSPAPASATPTGHTSHDHGKPHAPAPKMAAPVELEIAQHSADGASFELVLTATLLADVDDLALRLDKKTEAFGARKQGDVLTLAATVQVAKGAGIDAIGGATLKLGERVLTAAIAERVGTPAKIETGREVDVPGIGPVTGAKQ